MDVLGATTGSSGVDIGAFYINENGFDLQALNPATPPTGTCRNIAWHPSGDYVGVSHNNSPFISVYNWVGAFGAKVTNPSTLPANDANQIKFSPNGDYVAVAHDSSPYITVYPWSDGNFGVKIANPSTLPLGNAQDVAFHPDGDFIAIPHTSSPPLSIYPFDGSFGAKLALGVTITLNHCVTFSNNGDFLAIGNGYQSTLRPNPLHVYTWDGSLGVKVTDQSPIQKSNVKQIAFSRNDAHIGTAHDADPYITVYNWNGGFETKIANPDTLIQDTWSQVGGNSGGLSLDFHPALNFIAVGSTGGDRVCMYDWDDGFGVKYTINTLTNATHGVKFKPTEINSPAISGGITIGGGAEPDELLVSHIEIISDIDGGIGFDGGLDGSLISKSGLVISNKQSFFSTPVGDLNISNTGTGNIVLFNNTWPKSDGANSNILLVGENGVLSFSDFPDLGVSVIEDLEDVNISRIIEDDILIYNTGLWVATSLSEIDVALNSDLQAHISDANNPHSVTASQTSALISLNNISNPGGNIDLVAGTGISIVPNDSTNRISIINTNIISTIGDLNDTNITDLTDDEVLVYSDGNWINQTLEELNWSTNLISHVNDNENPHLVTATQIGAISSINSITSDDGNIDIVGGNGISVIADDSNNLVTIERLDDILLNDLSDVIISGATDNEILIHNSGNWINQTLTEVDIATNTDLQNHASNTSNPHSVTASQVGALVSVNNVANAGGNIDLVAGTGISITPDDGSNTITIDSISNITEVVNDISPILGGDLDTNDNIITTISSIPLILYPNGTGAIQADDNGDARGESAIDWQRVRTLSTQVASGSSAAVLGGSNNSAIGGGGCVVGGDNNSVSTGLVLGGSNNFALKGVVLGGQNNEIDDNTDVNLTGVLFGFDNFIDYGGTSIGGSVLWGLEAVANRGYQLAHSSGKFSTNGDAQSSTYILKTQTTDSSETVMDFNSGDGHLPLTLNDQDTWLFSIYVSAKCKTGANINNVAGYKIEGLIQRTGSTTSIEGSPTKTVLAEEVAEWDVNVSANDTDETLEVKVVGSDGDTIDWLAKIDVVQING